MITDTRESGRCFLPATIASDRHLTLFL